MVVEDPDTGCWLWQGTTSAGYGQLTYSRKRWPHLRIGRRKDHRKGWRAIMAHQLFYFLKYGNPPDGTELGHKCNRRSCCNPDHVRPITAQQNAAEMYRMPRLSGPEREAVEEAILEDKPLSQIAEYYCVSVWSVRQIAKEVAWRAQVEFDLSGVPF